MIVLAFIEEIQLQINQHKRMDDKLIERIKQFNEIKYGSNDNETRIVFATLKPEGTVTTAPKYK